MLQTYFSVFSSEEIFLATPTLPVALPRAAPPTRLFAEIKGKVFITLSCLNAIVDR